MAVCSYFLKGSCKVEPAFLNVIHRYPNLLTSTFPSSCVHKFGNTCRFSHVIDGANKTASNNSLPGPDSFETISQTMHDDLLTEKPLYCLSVYSPHKSAMNMIDGTDMSPEELRFQAYQARANNTTSQYVAHESQLLQQMDSVIKMVAQNPRESYKHFYHTQLPLNHPNSTFRQPTPRANSFGASSFGSSNQPSAFGQATSAFGGSSTGAFGAFGSQGAASGVSAFGQPSSVRPAVSAFGQQTSAFGTAPSTQPGAVTAFGQPSAFGAPAVTAFGGLSTPSAFGQPSQFGKASAFGVTSSQPGATPSQPGVVSFGATSNQQTGATAFGVAAQPTATSAYGTAAQPTATSAYGTAAQPTGGAAFGVTSQTTGATAFGTINQSGSNNSVSAFGQAAPNNPVSAFGQPSNPGTSFGQPSLFGQSQAPSAFGKPSAFGQSAFGQSAAFGTPAGNLSTTPATSAFGQSAFSSSPTPLGQGAPAVVMGTPPSNQAASSGGSGGGFAAFAGVPNPPMATSFGNTQATTPPPGPMEDKKPMVTAFGQPTTPTPATSSSIFGSSVQPVVAPTQSSNHQQSFGNQSAQKFKLLDPFWEDAPNETDLSPALLAAFKAESFSWDLIPNCPPPIALR
ncbi:hypothetical protein Pst134EA_030545 [Puccinia striiformis f. sp. tritici]|uniref:hypothetical protein n=2 Tax=Puccinia striiformis f. sp. tritici TaxID=168172 RepID=UPI0020080129|nr:hypothetical protein Pst134EA_030545 [Puccinia striiformis f. sp. tritici]KAH9446635.1 hypothetical protein Pst134EA_030545 [Puccinia striiformis f. sp. tritici]